VERQGQVNYWSTYPLTFQVPVARVLDRDRKMAGIAKKDEWKRTVDLHSLRHTFGTLSPVAAWPRVPRWNPCATATSA
jgi:hypothetical protein